MIEVTCAIIRNEDDEVLVVQRGEKTDHPLKWEFPGGKVHNGETYEECIIREIQEELSMDIVICGKLEKVEYDYGIKQIVLIPFICDTLDELPVLSEHVAFKWVARPTLARIDFSEADIAVASQYLKEDDVATHAEGNSPSTDEQPALADDDFRSMIEKMMSTKEVDWFATSAIDNPVIFKKLFDFSFSDDKKLAFRASWTLTKACDKYPEIIYLSLSEIISRLDDIDNESVQRSFLRILSLTDMKIVNSRDHGILADHCFGALRSGFSAIAIKAYSMEILYRLALIYPELANELSATINMLQGDGSAGIIARGRMILKKLAEMPSGSGSSQT